MLRLTDESHADHASLSLALIKVEEAGAQLNEAKRVAEQTQQAMSMRVKKSGAVQESVQAALMQPNRKLLKESRMRVLVPRFMRGPEEKKWTFFLYSDLLLWASTGTNTFKGTLVRVGASHFFTCSHLSSVFRIAGSAEFHQISVSECDQTNECEFMLHVQQSASGIGASKDADEQQQKLHLICATAPEKTLWFAELTRVVREARERILAERAAEAAKLTAGGAGGAPGLMRKSSTAAMMLFGSRPAATMPRNDAL